jgi:uncharacterized membrane protein YkvA (DUF1232 family)
MSAKPAPSAGVSHVFLERMARFLVRHPRWLMAAVLVYLVVPIDLFPELLLGPFGYLDDLGVLLLPYLLREYVKRLNRRSPPTSFETTAE